MVGPFPTRSRFGWRAALLQRGMPNASSHRKPSLAEPQQNRRQKTSKERKRAFADLIRSDRFGRDHPTFFSEAQTTGVIKEQVAKLPTLKLCDQVRAMLSPFTLDMYQQTVFDLKAFGQILSSWIVMVAQIVGQICSSSFLYQIFTDYSNPCDRIRVPEGISYGVDT